MGAADVEDGLFECGEPPFVREDAIHQHKLVAKTLLIARLDTEQW